MAIPCPTIMLNDGHKHPTIGFGTYKVGFVPASASAAGGMASTTGASATEVVAEALRVGYRFLDCAQFYGNEREVGEALRGSGIPREELFLASKVWSDVIYAGYDAVQKQVAQSMADLGTSYLDLYLVHWPVPVKHIEAYKALEDLQRQGKLRSIGVSNYTVEDYQELRAQTTVPPAVNQIEVNPSLYRKRTIEFFQKEKVAIQAYRPLRQGKDFGNPTIQDIAETHHKTPAQVMGRWVLQHGLIHIPKSEKVERMIENANILDFELAPEDMAVLDSLTTPAALAEFRTLYEKCVVRDTALAGTRQGVKVTITVD